jgi:hypothetical protein
MREFDPKHAFEMGRMNGGNGEKAAADAMGKMRQ